MSNTHKGTRRLETQSYKGVRDFYPEDQAIQEYIFGIWRTVAESFGYVAYSGSILEPAELYRAKTGDEIVNEQTYTFTDRGGREVTLRPEMTPTVARMVAARKRELPFPLRWFSIPNLFRYENPQRGRLREHWQLNVDLFGAKTIDAEVEVIALAVEILRKFGLTDEKFSIRINSRTVMNAILIDWLRLSEENSRAVSKLIDRKEKMPRSEFDEKLSALLGEHNQVLLTLLNSKNLEEFSSHLPTNDALTSGMSEIKDLLAKLEGLGITNAIFDQTLMRGFDYYTGIVFEIFDTNPNNRRSLFGGGRYDELLNIFGSEPVPAVGFGMGDVTMRDVLETYNLLPAYTPPTDLYICHTSQNVLPFIHDLAATLRGQNIRVAIDLSERKVGDQIKTADKHKIPCVVCVGEEEVSGKKFTVKCLADRSETTVSESEIHTVIKKVRHEKDRL